MNQQLSLFDLPIQEIDPYLPTPEFLPPTIIYRLRKLPNCSKSSVYWAFIGVSARENWQKLKAMPPGFGGLPRLTAYSFGLHRFKFLPPSIQPEGTWHFVVQDISCPKDFLPPYHIFKDLKNDKKIP